MFTVKSQSEPNLIEFNLINDFFYRCMSLIEYVYLQS